MKLLQHNTKVRHEVSLLTPWNSKEIPFGADLNLVPRVSHSFATKSGSRSKIVKAVLSEQPLLQHGWKFDWYVLPNISLTETIVIIGKIFFWQIVDRTKPRLLFVFFFAEYHLYQGGEIRYSKTLNLSRNTVFVASFRRCFPFFSLRKQRSFFAPGPSAPLRPGAKKDRCFRRLHVFHLAWSTCRATKTFVAGWRKLLWKVERGSTLSDKFWLCCSFFIKLTTCRATTLLVL